MTKYVLTYHGGSGMPETQEEVDQVMATWGAWFGQMGESLVDGGNPFSVSTAISPDGSVGDAVVPELNGYSIINADSLDAAVTTAKGCPVLANGGSVQVSEAVDM